mmetsp:Transcript_29045/g.84820  ORF Transcript_29045/g.84820 Transcript_29045/m.84820 type:complete len:205 (-) Transcript_29045:352-966(-)|eukprot:CAMPEP_0118974052 /NCGR_PEP_ID=MMETSP1173-20130426/11048_1 /TAXON_ID=1034831 /ORGANISM="Rhizochromulina marina cf, Strain CCMP1243" /LENGTH=204 /DNA_ID=CAMNT_0006923755 /DNA_START=52 /DNA_END=666 /DNA_ORIENTATION=-
MEDSQSQGRRTCHFKLVLLGDTAVGKSSLVIRLVRDEFQEYQEPTIGAAFLTHAISLTSTVVKFEIWDTAGQERYHSLAPMYYRDAMAAVVVYDITNKETLASAKRWINELKQRGSPDVIIALTGNKCDLEAQRDVSREEAQEYAESIGCLHFEASARAATGVKELFTQIAEALPKEKQQRSVTDRSFPVIPEGKQQAASSTCC